MEENSAAKQAAAAAAAASSASLALSATVAFSEGDYERATATFEQYLRNHQVVLNGDHGEAHVGRLDVLYGYADALAGSGRLQASLEVFAHISQRLAGYAVPLEKLHCVSVALVSSVLGGDASLESRGHRCRQQFAAAASSAAAALPSDAVDAVQMDRRKESPDPLCCAICDEVLRNPMTALCGHTFCGDCLIGQTQCCLCGNVFKQCKPDVLVQRLVEKWWTPEANKLAAAHLKHRSMNAALQSCNESLENCEYRQNRNPTQCYIIPSRHFVCVYVCVCYPGETERKSIL